MRTVRKPVPQLSTCKDCGEDFRYMRTLMPRIYCEECSAAKKLKIIRAWQDKQKIDVD